MISFFHVKVSCDGGGTSSVLDGIGSEPLMCVARAVIDAAPQTPDCVPIQQDPPEDDVVLTVSATQSSHESGDIPSLQQPSVCTPGATGNGDVLGHSEAVMLPSRPNCLDPSGDMQSSSSHAQSRVQQSSGTAVSLQPNQSDAVGPSAANFHGLESGQGLHDSDARTLSASQQSSEALVSQSDVAVARTDISDTARDGDGLNSSQPGAVVMEGSHVSVCTPADISLRDSSPSLLIPTPLQQPSNGLTFQQHATADLPSVHGNLSQVCWSGQGRDEPPSDACPPTNQSRASEQQSMPLQAGESSDPLVAQAGLSDRINSGQGTDSSQAVGPCTLPSAGYEATSQGGPVGVPRWVPDASSVEQTTGHASGDMEGGRGRNASQVTSFQVSRAAGFSGSGQALASPHYPSGAGGSGTGQTTGGEALLSENARGVPNEPGSRSSMPSSRVSQVSARDLLLSELTKIRKEEEKENEMKEKEVSPC